MIAAWVLLHALAAAAQNANAPVFCENNDPRYCVTPLSKGQAAPFMGELMMPALSIEIKQDANRCAALLAAVRAKAEADKKIDVTAAEKLRTDDEKEYKDAMQHCSEELQKQQAFIDKCEPPFYRQPWFVAPVVAILSASATAILLSYATR